MRQYTEFGKKQREWNRMFKRLDHELKVAKDIKRIGHEAKKVSVDNTKKEKSK